MKKTKKKATWTHIFKKRKYVRNWTTSFGFQIDWKRNL